MCYGQCDKIDWIPIELIKENNMKFIVKTLVSTVLGMAGGWLAGFIGFGAGLIAGFVCGIIGWYWAKYLLDRYLE